MGGGLGGESPLAAELWVESPGPCRPVYPEDWLPSGAVHILSGRGSSTWPSFMQGFPGGSDGKESSCNAGDPGLIPGSGRSLGKGMATQSSILAWRIPWTEEPGRLLSMGSPRVGHTE